MMMLLRETVEGMNSSDYKERFIAEHNQLSIRLAGLEKVIRDHDRSLLNFTIDSPIKLLKAQCGSMMAYKIILEQRAVEEGIELVLA